MMRRTYTDVDRAQVHLHRSKGHSQTKIAADLGIPRGTIDLWLQTPMSAAEIKTILVPKTPLLDLERQVRMLKGQLKGLEEANLTTEIVRREIMKLSEVDPHPPLWVPTKTSLGGIATPFAMLSDVHFGEITSLAATNGTNQYNVKTARQRLQLWADKLLKLCFDDRKHHDYPGLVLALAGDMISGDIHEELMETNELTTPAAILELMEILLGIIPALKRQFKRVFIPTTFGNHARNTRQIRFKRRAHSNFDWLLYCLLQRFLKSDPDITFLTPDSTDTFFIIQGRRFLLNHGDSTGAKGGDGFIGSLGPIKRGEGKRRRMAERMRLPFDHFAHGHYHSQYVLGSIFSNGAVCGYNEYAKDALGAEPEPAQQILAFIDEKYGMVEYRPVILQEETSVSNVVNQQFGDAGWVGRAGRGRSLARAP